MPVAGGAWLAPIPALSCRSQDVPAVRVQVSCGTGTCAPCFGLLQKKEGLKDFPKE